MADEDVQTVDSLRSFARGEKVPDDGAVKGKKRTNKKKKKEAADIAQPTDIVPSEPQTPAPNVMEEKAVVTDEFAPDKTPFDFPQPREIPQMVAMAPRKRKREAVPHVPVEELNAFRKAVDSFGAVPTTSTSQKASGSTPAGKQRANNVNESKDGSESEEEKCFRIRCKIERYYQAFGGSRLVSVPPKLGPRASLQEHRSALKAVESELDSNGASDGLQMMVTGFFTVLESFSAQQPHLGLALHGPYPLSHVLQTNNEVLGPTYDEFVIKHADWFSMSVERRLLMELLQVIVATRKLNSDPSLAAMANEALPTRLSEKGKGL